MDEEIKKVKLLDNGSLLDILIDVDNHRVIRAIDNKCAKILKVENNVLYVAGVNPNIANVIVYDDKFAVAGSLNNRNIFYSQPLEIWRADKSKALYYEIAKNACSSIVSALYKSNWKRWWSPAVTSKRSIWDVMLWHKAYFRRKHIIADYPKEKLSERFSNYTRFLVYDDPLKRFLRALNNKYIEHHNIASIVRPPYDENIYDFIDKVILVTQLDCLNERNWDQHLAPVSLNAGAYLDDITDFVYLADLNQFMEEKLKLKIGRHNVMPKEKKPVSEEMLLPYQIERIKGIYAKDYEIPQKYADKFYKPM